MKKPKTGMEHREWHNEKYGGMDAAKRRLFRRFFGKDGAMVRSDVMELGKEAACRKKRECLERRKQEFL